MSLELCLASGNPHKAQEFSTLLSDNVLKIRPSKSKISVDETGETFTQNAYLKAKAYYDQFKQPTLADDSGLVVEDLPDELGVRSARFGGDGLSDTERCQLLLSKLEQLGTKATRNAHFVCILCFYLAPGQVYFFEGRCQGRISNELKGEEGFGYDPLFIPIKHPTMESFASDPQWKELNSHRAKACLQAQRFFEKQIDRPLV